MPLGLRNRSRDVLVRTLPTPRAKDSRDRGLNPVGNFPILTDSTAAVRPIQLPNPRVPTAISSGEKFQGIELN
jgi:hypothetical protein